MSLHIHLTVGHYTVDRVRVSRVSNTGENVLDPDAMSTYQIDRDLGSGPQPLATVEHRYGDGARELARLALNALKEDT